MLLAHGASVLSTRHRRPPGLTARNRSWFDRSGFEKVEWAAPTGFPYLGGGAHEALEGANGVLEEGVRFFRFVGDES
jgi:hypothetical protein